MTPPTLAQQRGLAFAPVPFAILSSIACSCVIRHLLYKKPQKLIRLYHRLVLAMNVSLLALSLTWIWAPFSIPEGTPGYPGASGTIETCTASAFLFMTFSLSVPTYYASLILQAFMGIRNKFKEEKYKWIEKWVHIVAYGIPIALASVFAATENLNPHGSACYVAKAPRGCDANPNVPCERGDDIKIFQQSVGFSLLFLYFIFPPTMIVVICCWIRQFHKKSDESTGWQQIKETARKEMMQSVLKQIMLYLLSFWFTWVFTLAHRLYILITKQYLYGLLIFANCVYRSQGCVFAIVYFYLSKMTKPKAFPVPKPKSEIKSGLTVEDIRAKVQRQSTEPESEEENDANKQVMGTFSIFDGTPDKNSPWAKFFDEENDDDGQNDIMPEREGQNV